MSDKAGSEIKITANDLASYYTRATDVLKSISYQPTRDLASLRTERAPAEKPSGLVMSSSLSQPKPKTMKILEVARKVNGDDQLMEENINFVLNTVRAGLQIGFHLGTLHGKFSGLERLKEKQSNKIALSQAEQQQWSQLMEAQAAITLFTASYYIVWKLSNAKAEELSGINSNFVGLPEPLMLRGQMQAVSGVIFHFGSYLEEAQTGLEFLKTTQLYFRAVFDDIKAQSKAFEPNATVFTDTSYRLEGSEFSVNGFKGEISGGKASVEIKPVKLEEVVGNHEAKRATLRLSQFVVAYDFERKFNPFIEFNALPWIYLYKGEPGTGKTMLIRAMITLVKGYCENLGLPFRMHELSNTVISTFQGGSAENVEAWYRVLRNSGEIIVAPVDDAENVFQNRGGHNVSSGSVEATATLLKNTEGASAITRGNVLMPWGSNFPEKIDPAALSRIMGRIDVPGAVTSEDFMDQMGMWGRQANGWREGEVIVDLKWPTDYQYLSSQGITPPDELSRRAEDVMIIKDTRLAEIYDDLRGQKITLQDYRLYGSFFAKIHKLLPRFTSREVRNITTNVMMRLFGFDFDSSWLEDRETFVAKDYNTKKAMILDGALQNSGDTLAEILFQETVQYINTMVEIIDGGRSKRIKEEAQRIAEQIEAQKLAGEMVHG